MVIMMKDKFMKDDENNNEKVDEYNYDSDNDDYNYSGHINDNHDGVNDDVHNNGTGIEASHEDFFLRF